MRQKMMYTTMQLDGRSWSLLATEKGLCRIVMPNETLEDWQGWISKIAPGAELEANEQALQQTGMMDWLSSYFAGERTAFTEDIPLDLMGTEFQRQVWKAIGHVPYGETRTYGDIAAAIDRPSAVRAVGAANGANPIPLLLPCHRIIGANRKLTGFRGGLEMKRRLLDIEQIQGVADGGHARFEF
ncbi:methylated-DNA--[protein]-cysteine S-methyltransferase [Paenibacillus barcinonensis]|uniref:Methylated-DNA--protein-cysteine methyltransferase n=1 Tax=Paenibacillus barcinonensis TaxID=198119 RepID=A0A2V4WP52_PAEBA|nr:methylated-DNA--[protein]-cysteine S-methyltransferase [Paenibacillus barcinonensis]PYE49632.1 methylated-DNA-[protein]-cysteine S-methyltransferase [Paenibacillus barcinonensis]QKS56660.1 methylated-DNA--[protein]-cysteine S-methyltransferase [Paenibacillus barcinonensis]